MLITEAIAGFASYLQFEKRFSSHTVRAYIDDLGQFSGFLKAQFDCLTISEITSGFVRTWLASLKDDKATAKTINRKISSMRSFFKYLLRQQIVHENPLTGIVSQKQTKRLPQFVAEKDIEKLWRHTDFADTWNGRTERLILMLFYQSGVRLSEIINLKESQVDDYHASIRILGKGNKERIIPANKLFINELKEYQQSKRVQFEQFDSSVLFVNEKGKKLYPKWVYNMVRKHLADATTIEKKSPHVLRHTFATHLLNQGAELNAVKELLGHSSLASTQVYTHNTIDKLKDTFRKAHPKA